ncbi:Threonine synthase [Candidatus Arcanobacter lacustris]|uniref:Threonine synthase n=1 Tax=Candidatus Arcanibacter lacustris TaxID=1607817 RepID=A0A0F5MQ23_9RICK|nr:Threonine synthase [Candidatus Arcanobacter lacustris]
MILYNIKDKNEKVSFKEAMIRGIGSNNGLFFPESLPFFDNIENLLKTDFIPRSASIMGHLLKDEFSESLINNAINNAFNFPIKLVQVEENIFALELFHGPTLAFKDFGARFMAAMLGSESKEKTTIITATSGDTGAAVAHAFYNIPNTQVVILYPHGRISELQEKLFCTLGGNIHTIAVEGDFDSCQALVKQCFADTSLKLNINSANSINISRVLAQIMYYFEGVAQLKNKGKVVVSVPSGNFGNLTAGLFAKAMGLPIEAFIASTNNNDTVPRYLNNGIWQPKNTIATISNAMDVSEPNNWPRIEELSKQQKWSLNEILRSVAIDENQTKEAMIKLQKLGYIADPHSAIAYMGLKKCLKEDEVGIFLGTAHPAKFKNTVDQILATNIELPTAIEMVADKKILSKLIPNDYQSLKKHLPY